MSTEIKFGTDGWRSVIADGFTFENVKRVTQATCDVLRKRTKSRLVLIGYDNRFFSDRFAKTAAEVVLGNGFRVEMAAEPISSPALSFNVRDRKAGIGIMITASHNPAHFNGFKLKGTHGGSVDETVTAAVEERLDAGDIRSEAVNPKKSHFIPSYLSFLKKVAKVNSSRLKTPVVFDAMYGPGGDIFDKLFKSHPRIHLIRRDADPLFGGINPEPIETNLAALRAEVLRTKAGMGIAVDGDADRIGVLDEKGNYLPPHVVMPLLLLHLIEGKKLKGKIIQTVSMGYLTRRVAEHHKLPFEEVAVGFKHIAQRMGSEKILLGGEESGGYGVGFAIPERDGILCALFLIDMLASHGKPLSTLVQDLHARFGASHFRRVDYEPRTQESKADWSTRIGAAIGPVIAGRNVRSVSTSDGVKVVLEGDAWLLLRPSGTEPLVRTYAEADTPALTDALLKEAERLVNLMPVVPRKSSDAAKAKKKKMKENSNKIPAGGKK